MPSNTTNISFIDAEGNNQEVTPAPVPNYIEADHQAINEIIESCSTVVVTHTLSNDSTDGAKIDHEAIVICNGKMVSLATTSPIITQLSAVSDCLPTGSASVPFVLFPMSATGITISQSSSADQFSIHITPMAWGTITKASVEGDYTFNTNYLDYPSTSEDAQ